MRTRSGKLMTRRSSASPHDASVFAPCGWGLMLLTSKSGVCLCCMFSEDYFFFVPVPARSHFIRYDCSARALRFRLPFNLSSRGFYKLLLQRLIVCVIGVFFRKIRFRGKGYYTYKNKRNVIAPQFGYSHVVRTYNPGLSLKFLTKTSILMFGLNAGLINARARAFFELRPINIFTGKGVRFSRQVIYRKTGKISSYR